MQRLFRRLVHGGVIFALAAMLAALPAHAGELDPDPEAKIRPPIGVAPAADDSNPSEPLENRIRPPIGAPGTSEQSQIRISPPGGAPVHERTWFDLFWLWLQLQVKISPPIG